MFGLGVDGLRIDEFHARQGGPPLRFQPTESETETVLGEHFDDLEEPFAARNHTGERTPYSVLCR